VVSSYAASQIYDFDTHWLRLTFPVSSVFGIFAVWRFAQLKVRYERTETNSETSPDFFGMFRLLRFNKQFLFFMIALFVLAFGNKIGEAVDPFRLRDELKLSYKNATLAISIAMNISQIAGVWFWARMSKKWDPLWLYMFAGVMAMSRPIALAVATDTFGLIIGMAIFGFGTSGVGLMAILVIFNVSHHDSRLSSYLGLYYFLIGVRGLIGPYIGALMLKHGISTIHIYYVNAAIIGTGAIMIILINVFKKQIARMDRIDMISRMDLD
jgi:predicted MFS family arabinose efflux permease